MARTRPPDFVDRLIRAATDVFASKGLSGARMSDVADAMGVAHGTVYTYVESKEALFGLLVDQSRDAGSVPLPDELPIPTPTPEELLANLNAAIADVFRLDCLGEALGHDDIDTVDDATTEVKAIVTELYDRTAATHRQATVLERSAQDLPELFQAFFLGVRRRLFDDLTEYLRRRSRAGVLRPLPDAEVAGRFVAETVTHFARHRHLDPDPLAADAATIRTATIDLVISSLTERPVISESTHETETET